jgi:hypothetical protein
MAWLMLFVVRTSQPLLTMKNSYHPRGLTLLALAVLIDAINPSRGLAKAKALAIDNLTVANRKHRLQAAGGQ